MLSLKEFKDGCIEEALRSLPLGWPQMARWDNAARQNLEDDCRDFLEGDRDLLASLEDAGVPSVVLGARFWRYRNGQALYRAADNAFQEAAYTWGTARLALADGRIIVVFGDQED